MSRSGYSYDLDNWELICYRGQVASAIRGQRGQRFLLELRAALDDLPDKRLCADELQMADGTCCAIGAVGLSRGIDMTGIDAWEATHDGRLSKLFDIANQLVRELEFVNDSVSEYQPQKANDPSVQARRWHVVSEWVDSAINRAAEEA